MFSFLFRWTSANGVRLRKVPGGAECTRDAAAWGPGALGLKVAILAFPKKGATAFLLVPRRKSHKEWAPCRKRRATHWAPFFGGGETPFQVGSTDFGGRNKLVISRNRNREALIGCSLSRDTTRVQNRFKGVPSSCLFFSICAVPAGQTQSYELQEGGNIISRHGNCRWITVFVSALRVPELGCE